MDNRFYKKSGMLFILLATCISSVIGQPNANDNTHQEELTKADYDRASGFLSYTTNQYIDRTNILPVWYNPNSFWYRILTASGSEFVQVDAISGKKKEAFDAEKLATALSKATGNTYQKNQLPFRYFQYSDNSKAIIFQTQGKNWYCLLDSYQIREISKVGKEQKKELNARYRNHRGNEILSPDGKWAAFIKADNLWLREIATDKLVQLTQDGQKDFGYATNNAGWTSGDDPILSWSPDSKKIATFKQDQRKVADMYLVTTNVGHPVLHTWKYALPGDSNIIMIQRVIIDISGKEPRVVTLQIPLDPHRATLSDDIASSGTFDDNDWSADSKQLAFVSTSRFHKDEKLRIADVATGKVREIMEEKVATQYESGWGTINWRYLSSSNEFIWFSERDNWGHLYLYDALTGKLKNQITKGNWIVSKLLYVDELKRKVYFIANGLEKINPYYAQLCSIGLDGKNFKILTPEAGNHQILFSPDKKYFLDTYSTPENAPVTTLKNLDGNLNTILEKADLSRLTARGWKPPTLITVKAANASIALYGLVFTPTHLDPNKKYPVIDYIYPGPQGGSVGSWSFTSARGDNQALAELGFVVVVLEGTSNPLRSKSFHDMSYGNMAINTLPDQITAIQQLAKKYPYMDTGRVGIWGHSGGGFATAAAMFRYPDFFKVGIAESGNHDNRNYEDDWGERYNGDISDKDYENQANETYAKNLKGKLLLVHGLMDNNVPPQNTLLVAEALEKANKDFDLIIFPNSAHGYGSNSLYMMRRRWDYFVKNLLGAKPPHEYLLQPKDDQRN